MYNSDLTDRDWDAETADALDGPEPEAEPATVGGFPMPNPLLNIIVVGSSAFDDGILVQAALLGWSQHHPDRDVILWTTGAPEGAEAHARTYAQANGWRASEVTPERMLDIDAVVVFAFTVGQSDVTMLVDDLAARRPVRQIDAQSRRPRNRWSSW